VDPEFRNQLSAQLDVAIQAAVESVERNDLPVPVNVVVRETALAKSSRPYKFLSRLALPVAASEAPGELIVRATKESLEGLKSAVRAATTQNDLFDVSTLETIEYWDPARALGASSQVEAAQVLRTMVDAHQLIKVTFFPWVNLDSSYRADQSVRGFLQESGLEVVAERHLSSEQTLYIRAIGDGDASPLLGIQGIRRMGATPEYATPELISSQMFRTIGRVDGSLDLSASVSGAVVGVLDSGVGGPDLDPWVVGRIEYDSGPDLDQSHGTFVAGLIVAARSLNDLDTRFPAVGAKVFDGQVLPSGTINEALLLERIEEVLQAATPGGPKVWNCSFGSRRQLDPLVYSTFAQEMDAMADRFGLLMVQAAGNYEVNPFRKWPPNSAFTYADRLASPAESVRAVTVGAIAHKDGGFVSDGAPASYSRRGPGFSFIQKPEVTHIGGDLDPVRELSGYGVQSILPGSDLAESVGTSFAAPLVSSVAAELWDRVTEGSSVARTRPELIKGLIAHSAALGAPTMPALERNYRGWGTPWDAEATLLNDSASFTTVHEVILSPGNNWLRTPFPVPACLLVNGNKLRADITLTISYAPPLDARFGTECVRYDVEGGFGKINTGPKGQLLFDSVVPHDRLQSEHLWESQRVEQGKWSPLKTYRKTYPGGTAGDAWGLRLSLTERVADEQGLEQRVYAILTFRALDPSLPVYSDGIAAVADMRYENRVMLATPRLRV